MLALLVVGVVDQSVTRRALEGVAVDGVWMLHGIGYIEQYAEYELLYIEHESAIWR